MTTPHEQLRADVFAALAPRSGAEANALLDALDLFAAYCGRFAAHDRRFSLIDHTPIDREAADAAAEIQARVVTSFGRYLGRVEAKKILSSRESSDVTPLPPAPSSPKLDIYSSPACVWRYCPHPPACQGTRAGCVNAPDPGDKGAA